MSPAEMAKQVLEEADAFANIGLFGGTTGWRVGISRFIEQPDTQVILSDTGGNLTDPKWLLNEVSIQIMVRGAKTGNAYPDAYKKILDVRDLLLGIKPRFVGDDWIDGITALGGIGQLGYDAHERPMLSQNLRMIIEPASTPLTNRLPL